MFKHRSICIIGFMSVCNMCMCMYIYSIQNALCRVHNNVLTYARTSMSLKDGPYAKGLIGSVTFKNRGKSCSKYK